jgi:hypothetical protein
MLDANPVVYDALGARIDVVVNTSRVLPDDANLPLELRRVINEHDLRVR